MRSSPLLALLLLALTPLSAVRSAAPPPFRYTVTDLGTLNGGFAKAINNRGNVVGVALGTPPFGQQSAFFFSQGTLSDLADNAFASDLNDLDQVVGETRTGGEFAFVYSPRAVNGWNLGMTRLNPLPGQGGSFAMGINNHGDVCGVSINGPWHPVVWKAGHVDPEALQELDNTIQDTPRSINDDGVAVGEATTLRDQTTVGAVKAVRWVGQAIEDLGSLGGEGATAYAINNRGQITGQGSLGADIGAHAFLYDGGMQDLGTTDSSLQASVGYGINNRGDVVGAENGGPYAVLWENKQPVDLSTRMPPNSPWFVYELRGINDAGQILAQANYQDGQRHYIILSPPQVAPTLLFPSPDAIVSPQTTFKVKVTTPDGAPTAFEIEVTGNDPSHPDQRLTFTTPVVASGAEAKVNLTVDQSLAAGFHTWKARTIDAAGNRGPDSETRTLEVFGGVDLSTDQSRNTSFWTQLRSHGWSFVIVDAWGGQSALNLRKNGSGAVTGATHPAPAENNLKAARNAGLLTAAYCFLNFNDGAIRGTNGSKPPAVQSGAWQVQQAVAALGSQKSAVRFLAIDVESQFLQRGGEAGEHLTPAQRVQRICEAVQATREAGLTPVIYTQNFDANPAWNTITGSSTAFSDLPLWIARSFSDPLAARDDLGAEPAPPSVPFGGWTGYAGRQYATSDPPVSATLFGVSVDLNVFNPLIFQGSGTPAGKPNLVIATGIPVRSGATITVPVRFANTGTAGLACIQLLSARLGSADTSTSLRVPWTELPAGGAQNVAFDFPGTVGAAGRTVYLTLAGLSGDGAFTRKIKLRLP